MIDLHTHILPGIDDGAKNSQQSIEMLRREYEQGVTAVVLTPHFYRDKERPERFFRHREEAFCRLQAKIAALPAEERNRLPQLILGAEVAWRPNLHGWEELPRFCIPGTKRILLELPFVPWSQTIINQLRDMESRTGITPIIAHLERYLRMQRRQVVEELMSLGFPVQLTAEQLLHFSSRGSCLRMLKSAPCYVLASDCHDTEKRVPNLGAAMEAVRRKFGEAFAQTLTERAEQLTKPSLAK